MDTLVGRAPLVYVVVVTFNGLKFLPGCFGSMRQTEYDNYRLLLVDNGSTDGCGDFVRDEFAEVEVLRVFPNQGYTRGVNAGIDRALAAGAAYVVVCNDDIEVLDARWLAEAARLAEDEPRAGLIGFWEATDRDIAPPAMVEAAPTEHIVGFALMLRGSMLRDLGTFDEGYGIFMDEIDLAERAAKAGYQAWHVHLPVLHHGGGTLPRKCPRTAYLQMRNGIRFFLKNRNPLRALLRAGRSFDVACNPWPLSFDPSDPAHVRMRNTGNVFRNLWIFLRSIGWNLAVLPWTLRARSRDKARIRAAKETLRQALARTPRARATV